MDGNDYVSDDRARALLAMSLTAYALNVPLQKVLAGRRDQRAALARQAAMYVSHVAFGISMARVASAFGRDRSTVGHACRLMEDRRDDARFDRWMDALERSAEAAPKPFAIARASKALLEAMQADPMRAAFKQFARDQGRRA